MRFADALKELIIKFCSQKHITFYKLYNLSGLTHSTIASLFSKKIKITRFPLLLNHIE